jgi:Calcineurin-like phosphoesterase/Purple acid Phosphatase, N-terminal domain
VRLGAIILIGAFVILPLCADEISLIRLGESWRLFRGTNEPSAVTAWRQPGFDDSDWEMGQSGFASTGDEGTAFPASPSFRSAYIRKTFNVADPSSIQWLILRLDYASGFVAYLNGQEILRRGVAGNPVPYNAYATNHVRGTAEVFNVSAYLPLLTPGENLLAIQLHRAANTNLVLVPELRANFQRGPFVSNASTNSIQIIWQTPVLSDTAVEFGTDEALGLTDSNATPVTNHVVALTNLLPGQLYYYRVRSSVNGASVVSPIATFRTLKMSGDIVFAVVADTHEATPPRFRIANILANLEADIVLHAGDTVQRFFTAGYADTRWFSIHDLQMRRTPYYVSFGNHDFLGGTNHSAAMLEALYLPTNRVTGTEHFYSFDHGDAHFVSLLVPSLEPFAGIESYVLTNNSPQYAWLTNDLAGSSKPWKIVFMHSPILGSGGHRNEDANGNGRADRFELQEMLLPIFKRYGVQAVFSGHDHNYERSVPTNGIHCFVAGGGGSIIMYSIRERDYLCAQFWKNHHVLKVRIAGDTLRMEAIDEFGQLFDQAVITRAPPSSQVWNATWNSPVIETIPANDGDGNIIGQAFDFLGTPIPAMSGEFSNLGDTWINNDATNLYVGLAHTLLRSSDNIFLFIESPHQTGVNSMLGLGNGLVDPAGQGVDGLDFLHNLSFTNFSPSVACLLGDERADGQFRSFARPGLPRNIGQGVFRLDSSFTDVIGARLQQFNLSPQPVSEGTHEGAAAEQNADFIEVAIPYTALGGIHPGDLIHIGAVVGGAILETNAQARDLDRGFLGAALHGSGTGQVLLEGLTVQLADYPPDLDTDGDGLMDRWEATHGLNRLSATGDDGAQGDPDADGATNWEEQRAGTDPHQPDSALRAQARVLDAERVLISWSAVPGRRYAVQWTTNLAEPFRVLVASGLPRGAESDLETIELHLPSLARQPATLFFRIQVVPP